MNANNSRQGGSISATELMDQLHNDPEYQRKMREAAAARRVKVAELRKAEAPIVADLRNAGFDVLTVWDLGNRSTEYPAALPILMAHFERGGYPDQVMESLGQGLSVKPAVVYWDRLKAQYMHPRSTGEETGAALALAAAATPAQLEDLISFLALEERGESRIYFLRPIRQVGGTRGKEVVESLRNHPMFGKEATALLPKRGRADGSAAVGHRQ